MASVTANKMTSLVKKGKLTGLQVVRLIHQHYAEGLSGRESTGFSEEELHKLTNNLEPHEWKPVKHWVHDGIDLLYGFAMNAQSNAAIAASEIYLANTFLTIALLGDEAATLETECKKKPAIHPEVTFKGNALTKAIENNFDRWKSKNLSTRANMHSALWHNEGLKVVSKFMDAEWDLLPLRGMQTLYGATSLTNDTINDLECIEKADVFEKAGFTSFKLDRLKPSKDTIKEWKTLIEEVEIRDFLLNVAETQVKDWERYKEKETTIKK